MITSESIAKIIEDKLHGGQHIISSMKLLLLFLMTFWNLRGPLSSKHPCWDPIFRYVIEDFRTVRQSRNNRTQDKPLRFGEGRAPEVIAVSRDGQRIRVTRPRLSAGAIPTCSHRGSVLSVG